MIELNLEEATFDRLTAKTRIGTDPRGEAIWRCECLCGNTVDVLSSNLRSGHTRSCGCLKLEGNNYRHGMSKEPIYQVWVHMLQRCNNPKATYYANYGGRGIRVCDRWHEFTNFLEDMGTCEKGETIDRIDNDGDYCKENCRWSSQKEQARNRSSNVEITFEGKTQCIAAWEEERRFNSGTLWTRLYNYNWPLERAMTEPVKDANRKLVEFNGKLQSIAQHARDMGLKPKTVNERIRQGKTLEEALTVPLNKKTK